MGQEATTLPRLVITGHDGRCKLTYELCTQTVDQSASFIQIAPRSTHKNITDGQAPSVTNRQKNTNETRQTQID